MDRCVFSNQIPETRSTLHFKLVSYKVFSPLTFWILFVLSCRLKLRLLTVALVKVF